MRTGIEWHEQDRPLDATNTTVQLEAAKDWIQFTLAQPMDADHLRSAARCNRDIVFTSLSINRHIS